MNSPFLSHLHSHLRMARLTRRNATHRPQDVPRGTHKEYSRMERVELPEPKLHTFTLEDALKKRRSGFAGNPDIPVSLLEMGTLLGLALGRRAGVNNRNYPSGGALFPVETYLISTALESQEPAAFHYNPTKHILEKLWELPPDFNIKDVARHPEDLQLSALIVFTSVWYRSAAKYGDLAYLHALIEAGHMSENILLVATGLGLQTRPYAGFNDTLIEKLLDLNAEDEQPIHSIVVCKGDFSAEPTSLNE